MTCSSATNQLGLYDQMFKWSLPSGSVLAICTGIRTARKATDVALDE